MVLAGVAWLLTACAPAAVAPEPAIEVDRGEIELARIAYVQMLEQFPAYDNAAVQGYVQSVGTRLLAGAPRINVSFRFTVLDSPGDFAASLADGQVVISRGMLINLNTEAQLAAVLGHEIGHVVSLHQVRQQQEVRKALALEARLAQRFSTRQAQDAVSTFSFARVRGYSREYEIEADEWSERLLTRAGYDRRAMVQVMQFLIQEQKFAEAFGFELWDIPGYEGGRSGVFATHPSTSTRLDLAMQRLGVKTSTAATADPAYLNVLNNMLFGLAVRYGVQRGTRYTNPTWGVALSLPEKWYVFGAGENLVAAPRNNGALLIMRVERQVKGEPLRRTLEKLARRQALGPVEPIAASTLRGETAVAQTAGTDPQSTRLAVVDIGERRLSFVGVTSSTASWTEMDKQFFTVLRSLRPIESSETRVAPLRVQIERAKGDGVLAHGATFAEYPPERGELLNQVYPRGRVVAGQPIKTVR